MSNKRFQLELFYATCTTKKQQQKTIEYKRSDKRLNYVENPQTVDKYLSQNRFRRFKEGDISLEDKPKSGKPGVEGETLVGIGEQQPSTSSCSLSAELGLLQSTINRHLHHPKFWIDAEILGIRKKK